MVRVVVDATPVLPKPSGVGLYVLNLLWALRSLQASETFSLGVAYQPSLKNWLRGNLALPEALAVYDDVAVLPLPVRLLNLLAKVPRNPVLGQLEHRFGQPDIYHGTNYAVYPCRHSQRVMTIYDLSFLRYPEYVTAVVSTYSQRVQQCLGWTDLVVTISESSKRDIVEYMGVSPERIWVTPLASRYADDTQAVSRAVKAVDLGDRPYILFVSTLEPRKNVVRLIQAFDQLKNKHRIDHQLVLVGQKGWQFEPIFEAIAASPWKHHIRHLDYLSDAEVAYCYKNADVFAYPSLYEGFGLPVLEAMTLGCPVVTANTSSLPEVAGDAALLVDPTSVEDLAEALGRVIGDRSLRQAMIAQGYQQAAQFSWTRTAKLTLAAYRSLL
ncbi:glycosyltransferase family 1 protein [Leptolyngbya sp. FACHB-60]|uniref:glycosyltransferase family 4 protein n=1 Tax=unclassified Leptolyngbya TaxID=2650499 RepID=UPI001688ECFE|nr:glycosyltransferase family 1 protein [Leptolyngbya sp. FACHB-60]MBD1914969.1 glycosyltransferase family 4 protein [Phormidium sp. FACHB-77]MBD2032756.1 glycosyltransferase family 4 protein [Phormidium sp. FACHB-322]MBD2049901.1 glycosyltransferase family 4 protein [Leptolyngbya sp. FACHB-60]